MGHCFRDVNSYSGHDWYRYVILNVWGVNTKWEIEHWRQTAEEDEERTTKGCKDGHVYLRQVWKEDLTGASPQNVPVTPRHKLLIVFFKHL